MNNTDLTPFVATHPGEMIKDELKERHITQKQLAAAVGISASVLSEIINGKRPVSISLAHALAAVLEIPADIWMSLQTQYDIDSANISLRDNSRETISVTIPSRDKSLFRELAHKFGWACAL
ncbi:MAG: HigA family addiction module antidote protein [Bacteroidaceae bacterium]|nr:HigA family addiction module antidote protein [Bacteroidaceae bacterium]